MDQEKTDRIYEWQCRLQDYTSIHNPRLQVGVPYFKTIHSQGEFHSIKWFVPILNPLYIDVKCWLNIYFLDANDQPIEVNHNWFWYMDEKMDYKTIHMDRDYTFYIQGGADDALSGVIRIPHDDAQRLSKITALMDRSEYDLSNFLPAWSPNLAVRSDRVKRAGHLIGIRVRENIFNQEYCSIELTPVVCFFNSNREVLKKVTCDRWRLSSRTGATHTKYVPLTKNIAEQLDQFYIQFIDPKCIFHHEDKLIRIEGNKSGYMTIDSGEQVYESNTVISNRGFEFARVTVEYLLFYNTQTPETPIHKCCFDLLPRSQLKIQTRFSMKKIKNDKFTSLRAEPVHVEWRGMHEIPE
ncbi:hypothetical protein ACFL4L_06405 [bacterium]